MLASGSHSAATEASPVDAYDIMLSMKYGNSLTQKNRDSHIRKMDILHALYYLHKKPGHRAGLHRIFSEL
jgi:hypothetical protein